MENIYFDDEIFMEKISNDAFDVLQLQDKEKPEVNRFESKHKKNVTMTLSDFEKIIDFY